MKCFLKCICFCFIVAIVFAIVCLNHDIGHGLFYSNGLSYLILILFAAYIILFMPRENDNFTEIDLAQLNKEMKDSNEYCVFLIENNYEFSPEHVEESNQREFELCNQFLAIFPDNICAIRRKSDLLFDIGRYNESMKNFGFLVNMYPEKFEYVVDYAKCFYALGDKDKAFEIIDKFYENKEKDDKYYYQLGLMYYSLKEYNEAIQNITFAIQINPNDSYYYSLRAKVYEILNDAEKSDADMKKYNELQAEFDAKTGVDKNKNISNKKKDKEISLDNFKNLKP